MSAWSSDAAGDRVIARACDMRASMASNEGAGVHRLETRALQVPAARRRPGGAIAADGGLGVGLLCSAAKQKTPRVGDKIDEASNAALGSDRFARRFAQIEPWRPRQGRRRIARRD